jgi:hypothetical protein
MSEDIALCNLTSGDGGVQDLVRSWHIITWAKNR